MALGAKHVHPMWTRTTTDIASPELTIFYRVLTATYNPDALEGAPPPPRSQLLVPPQIPGTTPSKDMVDWERKRKQPGADVGDSSDEENARRTRRRVKGKQKTRNGEVSTEVLQRELYVPHGAWAWAASMPMKNVKTELDFGGTPPSPLSYDRALIWLHRVRAMLRHSENLHYYRPTGDYVVT